MSKFTQALADEICERLESGELLIQICRDAHMVDRTQIWRWERANEDFAEQIKEARARRMELWAEEILDIADNGNNDWMAREMNRGKGKTIKVPHIDHINRSRLRVDTRKWLLSRLNPEEYGEVVKNKIENTVDSMTQEQIDAQLAKLMAKKDDQSA